MQEKSRIEFLLEFIKVIIWPVLIVIGVFWLGDDFKEILKSRTWKIGGVLEVGDRVSSLESTVQDQLLSQKDFLNKIILTSDDSGKVKSLATEALNSIESAQKGVKQDIQNIEQVIPRVLASETGERLNKKSGVMNDATYLNLAKGWEISGFNYLMSRDVAASIKAFSEAEKIWPDYHNVAEIRQLLIRNNDALVLKDSAQWKVLYQKILNDFSWGMPAEIRNEMHNYISQK